MSIDSKNLSAAPANRRVSRHCSCTRLAHKLLRNDQQQDCEWERRMKQLNPTWNPSAHSLEAYL